MTQQELQQFLYDVQHPTYYDIGLFSGLMQLTDEEMNDYLDTDECNAALEWLLTPQGAEPTRDPKVVCLLETLQAAVNKALVVRWARQGW